DAVLLELVVYKTRRGAGEAVETAADRAAAREQIAMCWRAGEFAAEVFRQRRESRFRDHVRQGHIPFACEPRTEVLHLPSDRCHGASPLPCHLSDELFTVANLSVKPHSGRGARIRAYRPIRYPRRRSGYMR